MLLVIKNYFVAAVFDYKSTQNLHFLKGMLYYNFSSFYFHNIYYSKPLNIDNSPCKKEGSI